MRRIRRRGSKFHHETNVQTDGIAFLSDSIGTYSGGRYYEYTLALAANEHTKVKYYNQGELPFIDNFTLYQQPPVVKIGGIESFEMETARAFFGSQLRGALHAIQQGFKYKRPVFITIYESPKSMLSNIHVTKNGKLAEEMHIFKQIKSSIDRYGKDIPFLKVITLTKQAKTDLANFLKIEEKNVCVIPPCINNRVCNSIEIEDCKENFLLYVGRNNYRKNLRVLLKIYSKVKDKYDLHMILDSEDGLPEIATEYGIPHSKIKTYTGLSDFNKFVLMNKSKALISTSRVEGFGMWAAEAIACGTPVYALDLPSLHEMNLDGVYQFSTAKDMVEALEQDIAPIERDCPYNFERMKKEVGEILVEAKLLQKRESAPDIHINIENGIAGDIDVALATKNRPSEFKACIQALNKQTIADKLNVWVLDGNNNKDLINYITERSWNFAQLHVMQEERYFEGRVTWPKLYNFIFDKGSSKYLTYWSDDIKAAPDAFELAYKQLEENDSVASVIFGDVDDPGRSEELVGIWYTSFGLPCINFGIIRREAFPALDDETFKFYHADSDATISMFFDGWDLIVNRDCKARHVRGTWKNEMSKSEEIKADYVKLIEKWTETFPEKRYPKANPEAYEIKARRGKGRMKLSRAVICGCCQNSAKDAVEGVPLTLNLWRIKHLMEYFKEAKAVIFENNSKDSTKHILHQWREQEDFNIVSEDIDYFNGVDRSKPFSYNRMNIMSYARNRYLNVVKTLYPDYDYVIMLDLDLWGGFSYDGLATSFGYSHWDVMVANGIRTMWLDERSRPTKQPMKDLHWDAYAFREEGEDFKFESETNVTMTEQEFDFIRKTQQKRYQPGEFPVPIRSGFGGLAVYRMPILMDSCYVAEKGMSEHISLHDHILSKNGKIYLNPSQLAVYNYNELCIGTGHEYSPQG